MSRRLNDSALMSGTAARTQGSAGQMRLSAGAAAAIRAAIGLAGGREVCFVARPDEDGVVQTARAIARGRAECVLALPGSAQRGDMLIHNHPSGNLEPSDADMSVASRLHDDGVGFAICDNEAKRLYVVVEVPLAPSVRRVEEDEVAGTLGPGGPVAAALDAYEDRESQRELALAILDRYNDGGIGLFEAGTGVGKSLGYLVPALKWAAANDERTIVSTNTINLQEQLFGKDLPFLARALGESTPVKFALLKGWRNYLCLLRLEQTESLGTGLFDAASRDEFEMLRAWASSTKDGSLADLAMRPRPEVWDEVAAEGDLCTRLKCPHFDKCFVFAARRKAAHADVIVVNHHLLLADLAVRRANGNWTEAAVLPAYKRLVVDEGHHLEDVAAHHLGASVSRISLLRLFARLDRRGKGLLPALEARLGARDDLLSTASLDLVRGRLMPSVAVAREHGIALFDRLGTLLDDRETVMRIADDFANHPAWNNGLRQALDDLLAEIALIETGLDMVRERLRAEASHLEEAAQIVNEIAGVSRRLTAAGEGLVKGLRPRADEEPTVRWIERRGRERNMAVTAVPLDVAPVLNEYLWSRMESAVVTSATLAQGADFSFIESQLGVDDPELDSRTAVFKSPFRFDRQALLVIPTDIPAPNVDAVNHRERVMQIAHDLATITDGGLFVLFTSHREVRHAADVLRGGGAPWPVLMHGEDSRDALLRRFRESGRAMLVGTASFWEGVDVPGSALRGLVLAKLPFRVPSEPITAAQCEAIQARGGDPFTEYMLPHATLRLKQGFGRLIRTAHDRGVVVLCDPRISTKRYGRVMLSALPPAMRIVAPWDRISPRIESFYSGQEET